MLGDHIGHYKILEKIGEGGMGVVYRALDTRLEREVALKFLSVDFTGSEELKKRFYEEAKAASALDHPNICTIHAIDETDDGRLFIAMGYYQGETVKARLRQGPLCWEEIVDLAMQITSGLQAAHERGIIHLDIKPANLMVTPDGVVKILDFGLSRFTSEIDRTRPQGPLMGTVAYMSPELVQGEETGPESDIWALGVVMWEMATGVRPFQGKNDMAVLYSIVHKECGALGEKNNELPAELKQVIRRMLAKDRGRRYQTTAEVLADLEPLHQSSQTLSGELPWVSRQDWQRQRLIQRVTWALAAVVLLALVIILLTRPPPVRPTSDVLIVDFEAPATEAAPEHEWLGMAFADLLAHRLPGTARRRWFLPEELPLPEELEVDFNAEQGLRENVRVELRQTTSVDWVAGIRYQVAEGETAQRIEVSLILQDLESGEVSEFEEKGRLADFWKVTAKLAEKLGPLLELEGPGSVPVPGATEMPTDPLTVELLEKAREKLRLWEFKVALDDLRKAISRDPGSPILHLSLAEAYKGLYQDREALEAVETAIVEARKLPLRDQIYYLASKREIQGNLNRAAALFRAWWIAEDPHGGSDEPQAVDRALHVALAFANSSQHGDAVELALDRLRPLAAGDPRLLLLESSAVPGELQAADAAQVVEMARRRNAPLLEAQGLYLEAKAWTTLGEYERAAEKLERARGIYVRTGYAGAEANALLELGRVKAHQQDFRGAEADFDRAARLYDTIGNRLLRVRVLNNKAVMAADNEGEVGTAIEILRKVLPVYEEEGLHDVRAAGLINMCDWQAARGQFREADKAIREAFEVLKRWQYRDYQAQALIVSGRLLTLQGELSRASEQLNQAIRLYEEAGNELYADYSRSVLAQTRFHQGELEDALRLQERALATYYENGDMLQYTSILAEKGRVLMTQGELARAAEAFREGLDKSASLSNPEPAVRIQLYQAQLFFAEDKINDAIEESGRVLKNVAENSDFLLHEAEARITLSRSHLAREDLEAAEMELEKARKLLEEVESPIYRLPLEALEARISAANGRTGEAHDLLRASRGIASNQSLRGLELEIKLAQAEIWGGSESSRRNKLAGLADEADLRGYGLVALLAREAMKENADTSP